MRGGDSPFPSFALVMASSFDYTTPDAPSPTYRQSTVFQPYHYLRTPARSRTYPDDDGNLAYLSRDLPRTPGSRQTAHRRGTESVQVPTCHWDDLDTDDESTEENARMRSKRIPTATAPAGAKQLTLRRSISSLLTEIKLATSQRLSSSRFYRTKASRAA